MTGSRSIISALVILQVVLGGCGDGRSIEAFCGTVETEGQRLSDKYEARFSATDPEEDPLGSLLFGLGSLAEGLGDAVVLYDRLEKVAPEEIRPEVAAVRDGLQQQVDAMSNSASDPLGALGAGLFGGFAMQGSMSRVDAYIVSHCDS
jgi:hypothetical protein